MLNKNIEWSIKSHITMQSQNTMEPFSEQNELMVHLNQQTV
jgi:hypothetical protein